MLTRRTQSANHPPAPQAYTLPAPPESEKPGMGCPTLRLRLQLWPQHQQSCRWVSFAWVQSCAPRSPTAASQGPEGAAHLLGTVTDGKHPRLPKGQATNTSTTQRVRKSHINTWLMATTVSSPNPLSLWTNTPQRKQEICDTDTEVS